MAAGSVILELLFKTGSFETDTDRAAKKLSAFQKQAISVGAAIGTGLVAGATAAAAAFELLVSAAGNFKDLEQETGASAESLASLSTAAAVADLSVQDIANSTIKLTKALTGVDDASKPAGAGLKALGLNIADFKKLDPVAQIDALTKAFAGFADGSGKTAVAVQLFGKNGAQMLKVLQELNDEGGRQVILTQAQIELADNYTDKQKKLLSTIKQYAEAAATDVLPALNALTEAIKDGVAQLVGISDAGSKLTTDNPIKTFAEDAGRAIAGFADYVHTSVNELRALGDFAASFGIITKQLVSGDIAGAKQTGADFRARHDLDENGMGKAGKAAAKSFVENYNATLELNRQAGANQSSAESSRLNRKPTLTATGVTKDTSAKDLKAQLDGELKLIRDGEKAQADAYQFANSYLQGVYQDGLISQGDFFDAQKKLRDANLANVVDSLNAEIAAEQKVLGNKSSTSADRIKASSAIALAEQQRAEAITKASAADILAAQSEAREVERLAVSYDNLKASILAATGNEVSAQQIKNAQTLKAAAILIQQADGDPAVLGQLEKQIDLQTERTAQQKAYGDLLDDTQRKEAEIYLDAEAGGKSELDTLAAIRDARKVAIAQLQAQADAAQRLADTEGSTDADKKRAADLALAVKKAQSEIDPLAKSINDSLEGSFSSAFAEFINGSKSAKDAFKDFTNSVLNNIADIASKQLAKAIFGDTGGSSGLGGLLSGLFNKSDNVQGTVGTAPDVSNVVYTAATGTNFVQKDNSPFLLHRGEAVVPAAFNPANGGRGGNQIVVEDHVGASITTKTNSDGTLRLVVKQAVAASVGAVSADLASGTGPASQAVRGRFNLGPGSLAKRG